MIKYEFLEKLIRNQTQRGSKRKAASRERPANLESACTTLHKETIVFFAG